MRSDFVSFGSATENIFTPTGQIASLWSGTGSNNSLIMGKAYWGGTPIESYIVSRNMAFFQSHDGIGSISLVMDALGNVTGQRTYLPFGDGLTVNIGSRDNSFDGFAGLWDGGASSSNHAQFREYSNSQGRWLAPDPYDGSYDLGNPQSFNRYAYVLNNPLLLSDKSGLDGGGGGGGIICYSAVAQGGVNIADDAGCAVVAAFDYFFFHWLLGGPSFHGSLQPRPETTGRPDFSGPILSEHIGLPAGASLPGGRLGNLFGLPSSGCEFGACGGGPSSFQAGAVALPAAGGAIACAAAEPCGAIVLGGAAAALVGTAIYQGIQMSKGGKGNVGHDYVRDLARTAGGDYCSALKAIVDSARRSGNSKLFNDAKATYKQDCRGY